MSDALIVAFQSQLALVMETILKSAMMEITRLVEDSFMEEVGRGKKEVELLMRRLQFSENKLKEQETRVRCVDCGRTMASDERTAEQPAETITGTDTLCFSLSLKEQSEKRPVFSEVWRSADCLDSYVPTETPAHTEEKSATFEQGRKQDTASDHATQIPRHVLQKLLPDAAVMGIHEHSADSRELQCSSPMADFSPSKEIDFGQSRLTQSGTEEGGEGVLAPSPHFSAMKSEHESDPVPIKEEEEMLPVWDCGNDGGDDNRPAESDHDRRDTGGSWSHEETQVDSFPNLSELDVPDPTSYLMSCPVKGNAEKSLGIKAESCESIPTDLLHPSLAAVSERSSLLDHNQNDGHLFSSNQQIFSQNPLAVQELCPGETVPYPVPPLNHFPQKELPQTNENLHTEKPHSCSHCGKLFSQAGDLKVHKLTHQGKKPLSCSQCSKSFVHNFELKDHQRQHSGERPYVCAVCGKAFGRLGNFKQHQNIHTREKLFGCPHCGMRFNRSTHLRIHLRRHNRVGKSCHCRQCGKTFVCLWQLKGHLLKAHGTGMC